MQQHIKAFIAGFVSTLVFHQLVIEGFHLAGKLPNHAWNMAAVPPLGVPSVISLAFWGGVWGIPIWLMIRNAIGGAYWARAIILGALLPSAVALFIVFPIKGMGMAGGWDPTLIIGALIVNGVWGFGVGLLMKLMNRKPALA